ncbi:hypothetical protein A1O7_05692 [Cladophialophora yegresii CBS 114405]|uniref:Uncharacterized protein n=1 Tax=Cladophialophora yegresii CBS 114405 TaxID=1182544 RepID=W9VRC1_9EURO|nr:uncharacterized protein A1O7_05692 [Cladophialophora yegresii CBS 114405]EXJ58267.1 hypothetical protein A1O7_05692 [Cladophialophora yegresii CBS 114405]
MCHREVESWSCGCEVGVTKPCDYPTLACQSGAFFAPRLDHPYTCADCAQQSYRTGHAGTLPMTSPNKKRSSSQFENDDPRAYAQRVMDKRLSRPMDLDLNLSLPPKRSRTSLQKWSSDAPQHIGRRNNAYQPLDYGYTGSEGDIDMDLSSRLTNPAQDLAAIAMPDAPPAAYNLPDSHRPARSGSLHRIGSVVTRRPTKRSPTFPDGPISPISRRSPISPRSPRSPEPMRRVSPRQMTTPYAEPRHRQLQYGHQPYRPQHQPQHQQQLRFDFDGHPTYSALKDSIEREIYSGRWTRAQIQAWHRFTLLKPQDQYELLHTYADSMAAPPLSQQAVAAMQSRKKAKPVGQAKKYAGWRSWTNWFGWRK